MGMIDELRQRLSPQVKENVALAPFTTYRIGGPAEFFFEAATADEGMKAIKICGELGLPYFILGGGSNMLVADEGVKGLTIRMINRGLSIEGAKVTVEAGTPSGFTAMKTVEAGLAGFEWAAALPGTIGGAVRGNAGCYGGDMKGSVEAVRVFGSGQEKIMTNEECGFAYRTSVFKRQPGMIVLSAVLSLRPGQVVEAGKALMEKYVLDKKAKQPVEAYSAGCVFMNWKPNNEQEVATVRKCLDLNKEEVVPFTPDGTVPAGWIIDRAQLKGMKVGHVSVSEKHGNFFVSDGQARASEVIALTSAVKMKIRDMTEGIIMLLDEIEYVGF
jgi:UDP-N-acetylmuramate dehydrogenase